MIKKLYLQLSLALGMANSVIIPVFYLYGPMAFHPVIGLGLLGFFVWSLFKAEDLIKNYEKEK